MKGKDGQIAIQAATAMCPGAKNSILMAILGILSTENIPPYNLVFSFDYSGTFQSHIYQDLIKWFTSEAVVGSFYQW